MKPGKRESLSPRQTAVLERLVSALRTDSRVKSCWLGGSLGRGEGDAWSDLDLHVMVSDVDYLSFGETAYQLLLGAATPLMHWRGADAERFSHCFAFFDDGTSIDLVVHNAAHGAVFFSHPIRMVFGDEPEAAPEPECPSMRTPKRQGEVRQRVFGFWLSVSYAAKYIARGNLVMATGHLAAARGSLVQLCDLSRAVLDWCAPPILHATWGRLTEEEWEVLEQTLSTTSVAALQKEMVALVEAADTLLLPIAEAALCADFATQMKQAVEIYIREAERGTRC